MTTDDSGACTEPVECDCSICVPPSESRIPDSCAHAPDIFCENCRPPSNLRYDQRFGDPKSIREVCSVVGGLHGCDGSPHTALLPVSGADTAAAVVVHEVRDNLLPVRLEG